MSILSQVLGGPVFLRPRRGLGGLYPDVVVEESHEDSLEITEHPVEQGAAINDHAFKKPEIVTIRGGAGAGVGGEAPGVEFYNQLLALQRSREPFDIITGKRQYKNMLLETLTVTTDANSENCLQFTAQCREVIIVAMQVTSVPPRDRHASPGATGATQAAGQKQLQEQESSGRGSSMLHSAVGGTGHTRPGGAAPGYGG